MRSSLHDPAVVHIVPALFGRENGIVGGAERYALELARHMSEIVPTSLVAFGDRDREERLGSLRVRVIGNPWLVRGQRSNPFSPELFAEVRRAAIVHCHQQHVLSSSFAALSARLLGRRVFCTDLGGGGWDVSAYVSTDPWFHGHLHISEYSRQVAGQVSNPRAHVIWGGVDTDKFSPPRDKTPRSGVLFVGRLLPHKGVDTLIRALPADLPAQIVGPAVNARYAKDLQDLAVGKCVTFRRDCRDEELLEAYRASSCIVLPSVYRDMYGAETRVPELLGQTLLEGMATGLPAVCTSVASLPEIVRHGETGFVVPPGDPVALGKALRKLRDHPKRSRSMGQAARASVLGRFSWGAVVSRCLDLYGLGTAASLAGDRDIRSLVLGPLVLGAQLDEGLGTKDRRGTKDGLRTKEQALRTGAS